MEGQKSRRCNKTKFWTRNRCDKQSSKINQTDHAQGHICPNVEKWLQKGVSGLLADAQNHYKNADEDKKNFYQAIIIVMKAVQDFMLRYHDLLIATAKTDEKIELA